MKVQKVVTIMNTAMVTSHNVTLTGLKGNRTYYFRVGSTDGAGNGPEPSAEDSFITDHLLNYLMRPKGLILFIHQK